MLKGNKSIPIKSMINDYRKYLNLSKKIKKELLKNLKDWDIRDSQEIQDKIKNFLVKKHKIVEQDASDIATILLFMFKHTLLWERTIENELLSEMNKSEKQSYEDLISQIKILEEKFKKIFRLDMYKWKNTTKLVNFRSSVSLKVGFKEDFDISVEDYSPQEDFLALIPIARYIFILSEDSSDKEERISFDIDESNIKRLLNSLKHTLTQIEFLKDVSDNAENLKKE